MNGFGIGMISLNSGQEMVDICQIPDNILKTMTTANLSSLCLNYPLLGDMLFSNNLQEGFDMMALKFNGFQIKLLIHQ